MCERRGRFRKVIEGEFLKLLVIHRFSIPYFFFLLLSSSYSPPKIVIKINMIGGGIVTYWVGYCNVWGGSL